MIFVLQIVMTSKKSTIRPTLVNKNIYLKFANKCRNNGREIGEVEESLFKLYIKCGEKIFTQEP